MAFRKAVREKLKARVAFIGPAGSGKTWSSLVLALSLGERVAVLDSEHGSARKYAGRVDEASGLTLDFDTDELDSFSPEAYLAKIEEAERAGYDVLVIDSLTHAWSGKGGALEIVDRIAARSQSKNTFAAWREVTPMHNALVDKLCGCKLHLIVTMRVKTEYILEETERNGRRTTQPRKIGMAPIQRDGLEYEFDLVGDLDEDHRFRVTKTRFSSLDGKTILKPGAQLGQLLLAELDVGVVPPQQSGPPVRAVATKIAPVENIGREYGDRGAAMRALRPPRNARTRTPAPSGSFETKFSSQAQWPGAQQWSGKPLAKADLDTLLQYGSYVKMAAAAHAGTPKAEQLLRHHARVEDAIALREPSLELGNDPAGLGDSGCDHCPSNPQCEHYEKCRAAEEAAQAAAAEGEAG